MDDQVLLEKVEGRLAEYGAAKWTPFLQPNHNGAFHFLNDPRGRVSPTNTAVLCQLAARLPAYADGISPDECSVWKQNILLPAFNAHVANLTGHPDTPEEAEYDAYRVARLLAAVPQDVAATALV